MSSLFLSYPTKFNKSDILLQLQVGAEEADRPGAPAELLRGHSQVRLAGAQADRPVELLRTHIAMLMMHVCDFSYIRVCGFAHILEQGRAVSALKCVASVVSFSSYMRRYCFASSDADLEIAARYHVRVPRSNS